jgi:hypothetical protein
LIPPRLLLQLARPTPPTCKSVEIQPAKPECGFESATFHIPVLSPLLSHGRATGSGCDQPCHRQMLKRQSPRTVQVGEGYGGGSSSSRAQICEELASDAGWGQETRRGEGEEGSEQKPECL